MAQENQEATEPRIGRHYRLRKTIVDQIDQHKKDTGGSKERLIEDAITEYFARRG